MLVGREPSAVEFSGYNPADMYESFKAPAQAPAQMPPMELANISLDEPLDLDIEPLYILDLSGKMPSLPKLELPSLAVPTGRAELPDSGGSVSVEYDVPKTENGDPAEQRAPCQACDSRRYVDRSDDAGVSYQVPTKLSSSVAAIKVAAHEREHVFNERADAQREGAEVIHQSVSFRYGCCPECGKMYVAGGETRTVTSKEAEDAYSKFKDSKNESANSPH